MAEFTGHDAYIAATPEHLRPLLVQLRAQLALTLPDAEEIIAYDMPGFGFGKSIIAGFAAFSKQCGLYVSNGAITAHAEDIAASGLKATKTGVTFSPSKPISDELVAKLALASRKELGL
ncbi:iron chaperone [Aliiroseovarius sp. YM-037]|uniref:iron chaperone n=1 Tax=Aliiroseovarius sp. YM-037 TaxID=3341728 RepID=UPI003A7F8F02